MDHERAENGIEIDMTNNSNRGMNARPAWTPDSSTILAEQSTLSQSIFRPIQSLCVSTTEETNIPIAAESVTNRRQIFNSSESKTAYTINYSTATDAESQMLWHQLKALKPMTTEGMNADLYKSPFTKIEL